MTSMGIWLQYFNMKSVVKIKKLNSEFNFAI